MFDFFFCFCKHFFLAKALYPLSNSEKIMVKELGTGVKLSPSTKPEVVPEHHQL